MIYLDKQNCLRERKGKKDYRNRTQKNLWVKNKFQNVPILTSRSPFSHPTCLKGSQSGRTAQLKFANRSDTISSDFNLY